MPDDLRPYQERQRITEAGAAGLVPLGDGDYRVRLIAHGLTRDGQKYYRREALEAAANSGLYDGAKMFVNHRDPADEARRGHRDVRDWVSTVKTGSVRATAEGLEAVAHVHEPRWRSVMDDEVARQAIELSQDATITSYARDIDGKQRHVVESLERIHSVDWVPTGNAWGRVLEAYADATESHESEANVMPDLTDLTLDVLEVERPDLVEALKVRVRESEEEQRTYEAWNGLSADAVRDLLSEAIRAAAGTGKDEIGPWVRELYEDSAIVSWQGVNLRYTYAIVDNAAVLGANPVEVRQEWVPVRTTEAVRESGDANTTEAQENAMSEEQATTDDAAPETEEAPTTDAEAAEEQEPTAEATEEQEAAPAEDWQARAEAAEAELARREMREAVVEIVASVTGLTDASKRRVVEAVSAGTLLTGDALTEAVNAAAETERAHETELARALGVGTRVRRSGPSLPTATTEADTNDAEAKRTAAREAFKRDCYAQGIRDEALIEKLAAAR